MGLLRGEIYHVRFANDDITHEYIITGQFRGVFPATVQGNRHTEKCRGGCRVVGLVVISNIYLILNNGGVVR